MFHHQKITRIGSFHVNHCEDYVLYTEIGKDRILLAALDGCTMGAESYFASTLFGRLLRKITKAEFYREYITAQTPAIEEQLRRVFSSLFREVVQAKDMLQLERNELLTTVVLGIIDVQEQQGEVVCVGDGVVCVDGKLTEFGQNNQPDYLAYHLAEDFATWYAQVDQRIVIEQFTDLTLSTDGILSFVDRNTTQVDESVLDQLIQYLVIEDPELENENALVKKLNRIETEWNMINTDDLGMVRLVVGE